MGKNRYIFDKTALLLVMLLSNMSSSFLAIQTALFSEEYMLDMGLWEDYVVFSQSPFLEGNATDVDDAIIGVTMHYKNYFLQFLLKK